MILYSQQQLYIFLFFFLPESVVKLHSIKDGRSTTLDVEEWRSHSKDSNTEYGERGHSFGSRISDSHFEWGRSKHNDPFRSLKANSYPLNNNKKYYDARKPQKSHKSIKQNIVQLGFSNSNLSHFSCHNVVLHNPIFHIRSPFYPQQYPKNTYCRFIIKKAFNVCSLELDFRYFYLEPTVDCSKDWLLVSDRKYCGYHRQRKLIISLNQHKDVDFAIEFRSDSFRQFHGFYIVGRQLSCQPIPHQNPNGLNPFTRPLIQPHVNPLVLLSSFPTYGLHMSTDLLKRPNIIPPITPLINKVPSTAQTARPHPSYHPPLNTYRPVSIPTTQTFTSNSSATFNSPCDLTFMTPQDQFQSLNYPENYGPNLSCELRFVPLNKSFCVLELYFQDFYVEESKGCLNDALIIGGNRYCSSSLTDQRLRISFILGSSISLQFVTDSKGSFRGFVGRYRMLACEEFSTTQPPNTTPTGVTCDRVITGDNMITSVNYPLPYLKNLDCIYTIEKESQIVEELVISFIVFDLQNSTDCSKDYLEISALRYCGVQTGLILRVPFLESDTFEILFHSDGAVQQTGFKISVMQFNNQVTTAHYLAPSTSSSSSLCKSEIFNESSFLIISPQFPLLYFPGQDCNYNVIRRSQNVCELQLKFIFFSLSGTLNTNCEGDYLKIDNYRFCGDLSGQTRKIPFSSSNLSIVFHSDDLIDNEAQGFSIQVVQLTDCTYTHLVEIKTLPLAEDSLCKISLLPNGEVNSTEIQIRNDQECAYIINQEEDTCGVEFHFKEFYIPPSVNCSENYIEIDNRHFCGQQLNHLKFDVRFHVDGQPIYLPFHIRQHKKFLWNFSTSLISCDKIRRKQCSPAIWSQESILKYNAILGSKRECDFVIRRWSRRICRIQLDFLYFDITDQTNCESNYLEVGGKQLCGYMTGRKTTYEFSPSEDKVSLKLIHTNNVDLEIRVNQIQCR